MIKSTNPKRVEYAALEMEEEEEEEEEENWHQDQDPNEHQQDDHRHPKDSSRVSFRTTSCVRTVFLSNLPQWSTLFILLTMISSTLSLIPTILMIRAILQLTGRWYFCVIAILPQWLEQMYIACLIQRRRRQSSSFISLSFNDPSILTYTTATITITAASARIATLDRISQTSQIVFLLFELTVMIVLCIFYIHILPWICKDVILSYFTGVDGTLSMDWNHVENEFLFLYEMSRLTGSIYLMALSVGIMIILSLLTYRWFRTFQSLVNMGEEEEEEEENDAYTFNPTTRSRYCLPLPILTMTSSSSSYLIRIGIYLSIIQSIIMTILLLLSLHSATIYLFVDHNSRNNILGKYCDPLDTTECMLPFPSSFFTIQDDTTITGVRVQVDIEAMTTLYRGPKVKKPIPLDIFDGFLTSGPILFYLDGIKEGQEKLGFHYNHTHEYTRLISFDEMELSTTMTSMTLLLDLTDQVLVYHFAEIDSLNENLPVVIIQPAYPLKHNHRYAVALIDSIGPDGRKLHISPYLEILLDPRRRISLSETEKERGEFFEYKVIPLLHDVASWLRESNSTIQLLFDFHTMSEENQLRLARKTVESSLDIVQKYDWSRNVRIVKVEMKQNCIDNNESIDRVLHLEVDLPNFMIGDDRMARLMEYEALLSGSHNGIAPVKVVVLIPCKVAFGIVPLQATVQYGHGFLYSREEALNMHQFHKAANEQGYIIFASNWRGMSYLDLPVIVRAFISEPELMLSIRDNIIQGYANMASLQVFALHGLIELCNKSVNIILQPDGNFRRIYYGVSQGGILGAAFSSLLAPHNLLHGSVIVSAGTPFSLLMSRSTIFPAYHQLLRLGLHHDRHIRIFISILQMVYDTIEVGGILTGTSISERVPTLLQQGLGDSTVSNIASDFLSRVYHASTFESNPVTTFGLDIITSTPHAVSTDILFVSELQYQTIRNTGGIGNNVHICTRIDPVVIDQMVAFCSSGDFVDVCRKDPLHCIRESAAC